MGNKTPLSEKLFLMGLAASLVAGSLFSGAFAQAREACHALPDGSPGWRAPDVRDIRNIAQAVDAKGRKVEAGLQKAVRSIHCEMLAGLEGHLVDHAAPPPGSAVRAKTTFYGYRHDPDSDSNTAAGRGAYQRLEPGKSIALTPSLREKLHVKGGERVAFRYGDGTVVHAVISDKAPDSYRGRALGARVDIYAKFAEKSELLRSCLLKEDNPVTNIWLE